MMPELSSFSTLQGSPFTFLIIQYFGPNYQIIIHMAKKLLTLVFMLAIIIIPYSFIYHTVTEDTEDFKLSVILKSFYKMMWTVFMQIRKIVAEIGAYPIQTDGSSVYTVTSTFLFVSFPLYVLACDILLLNLIVASFA